MSTYAPTKEEKERFMSRAIELSAEGAFKGHGGPYGAVVVKNGKIVGTMAVLLSQPSFLSSCMQQNLNLVLNADFTASLRLSKQSLW